MKETEHTPPGVFLWRGRAGHARAVVLDEDALWVIELGELPDAEALARPSELTSARRRVRHAIASLRAVRKSVGTLQLDFEDGDRELVHWEVEPLWEALRRRAVHLRVEPRKQGPLEAAAGPGCLAIAVLLGGGALSSWLLSSGWQIAWALVVLTALTTTLLGGLAATLAARPPVEPWLVPRPSEPSDGGSGHA